MPAVLCLEQARLGEELGKEVGGRGRTRQCKDLQVIRSKAD